MEFPKQKGRIIRPSILWIGTAMAVLYTAAAYHEQIAKLFSNISRSRDPQAKIIASTDSDNAEGSHVQFSPRPPLKDPWLSYMAFRARFMDALSKADGASESETSIDPLQLFKDLEYGCLNESSENLRAKVKGACGDEPVPQQGTYDRCRADADKERRFCRTIAIASNPGERGGMESQCYRAIDERISTECTPLPLDQALQQYESCEYQIMNTDDAGEEITGQDLDSCMEEEAHQNGAELHDLEENAFQETANEIENLRLRILADSATCDEDDFEMYFKRCEFVFQKDSPRLLGMLEVDGIRGFTARYIYEFTDALATTAGHPVGFVRDLRMLAFKHEEPHDIEPGAD